MIGIPEIYRFSKLDSRSITAGNPDGAKGIVPPGKAKNALSGIQPGETVVLADIDGPGMIRMIWLTFPKRTPENLRSYVLRIYWDYQEQPSVAAPVGDFFGLAHGRAAHFSTLYLGASEGKGFHCFFPMPFSQHCRITVENDSPEELNLLFFQIHYTLGDEITANMGRFHAHFRRDQPPRGQNFVMLDRQGSPGIYVGTVIGALPREAGTWREGDIRFFIDGDEVLATITGTGWSDWFLSAWGMGIHQSYFGGSTYQVLHPELGDKYFCSCYRFHVLDPIYFQHELRVEYQQYGGRPGMEGVFHERADDWCATVYWYQQLTGQALPVLASREERIAGIALQDWEAEAHQRMLSGQDRHNDMD
ncbi:MAG: DUF2961 domain-containing protein [Anaerolineae bacterium]|nr:DUF2961 domain-containing protein [Anaerolineae bacterium]